MFIYIAIVGLGRTLRGRGGHQACPRKMRADRRPAKGHVRLNGKHISNVLGSLEPGVTEGLRVDATTPVLRRARTAHCFGEPSSVQRAYTPSLCVLYWILVGFKAGRHAEGSTQSVLRLTMRLEICSAQMGTNLLPLSFEARPRARSVQARPLKQQGSSTHWGLHAAAVYSRVGRRFAYTIQPG